MNRHCLGLLGFVLASTTSYGLVSLFAESQRVSPQVAANHIGPVPHHGPIHSVETQAPQLDLERCDDTAVPMVHLRMRVPIMVHSTDQQVFCTPAYPRDALRRKIEGQVTVYVVVETDGRVVGAQAVTGPAELRDAAVAAALCSRVYPYGQDGRRVRYTAYMYFMFERGSARFALTGAPPN